uniref:Protein kinase domain-containing protein n=1 Tax=Ananas comosus var. bracteatus TaxID=296719 RepID=A0A6V7P938_ANACO|nr:unnamed protein product [Ananas comosus var. bracteatus]
MLSEARSLPYFQLVFDVATFESSIGSVKLDLDSGECRDKSESRWRQIDVKRTPCDARAAYREEFCKTAAFSACCAGTRSVAVPVQPARIGLAALGLALVPVQEPVYRYKGVGRGLICILETSTPGSLEYFYARAGTPSGFLQGRLDCFELLGAVGVDGGPGSPFWRQIVPRAQPQVSATAPSADQDRDKGILTALRYCHARGVAHRNVKPQNLLLARDGVLKLFDFGLAALAEQRGRDGRLRTACGTPAYAVLFINGSETFF